MVGPRKSHVFLRRATSHDTKLDSLLLRAFQQQLDLQGQFVILAQHDAERGLPDIENDPERTFYGLQNMLNAAANISKALWGKPGTNSALRAKRESIGVSDDSPLRPLRMRNNYEHYDEK